ELGRPNALPANREIVRVEPVYEWIVGETRPSILLLGGVALLLLFITCVTAANALFVRVTARQSELAVRVSLGASQYRLVRQLLTEGILLSLAGAAMGSLLAALIGPGLRALVPSMIPRADEIGVSM